MKIRNIFTGFLLVFAWLSVTATAGLTASFEQSSNVVNIRSDRGGEVIRYALRAKKYVRNGSELRFLGRCDSACTLFLSAPQNKLCIRKGASFGFHLPYGASKSANATATRYMLNKYPTWVKSWIQARGGLKNRIERMDYKYASNFLNTCA